MSSCTKFKGMKKHLLSAREIEIVKLIMEENTTADIALKLDISARTVDTHRKNILRKTGIKNMVGLAKYAIQNEWLAGYIYQNGKSKGKL